MVEISRLTDTALLRTSGNTDTESLWDPIFFETSTTAEEGLSFGTSGIVLATNVLTNPSFETNTTNWAAINASISRTTAGGAKEGSYALQISTTGTSTDHARFTQSLTLPSGQYLWFSCWVYLPTASTGSIGGVVSLDFDTNNDSTFTYTATADTSTRDAWVRISSYLRNTGGTDLTNIRGKIKVTTSAAGQTYYADRATVVISPTDPTSYAPDFTGDTPGYGWNGTPHASTSDVAFPAFTDTTLTNYGVDPSLLQNGDAETNSTAGWLTSPSTAPPNGITVAGATFTNTTPGITGSRKFQLTLPAVSNHAGYGVAQALNTPFIEGQTYRARMDIRTDGTPVQAQLLLGDTSNYVVTTSGTVTDPDYTAEEFTLTDTTQTIYVHWTPEQDSEQATLSLRILSSGSAGSSVPIDIDNVAVQRISGHIIPAGTDFAAYEHQIPGFFSPNFQTAIKLRAVSGTIRPYGLKVDEINPIEITLDFSTALKALGEIRNRSGGELEFRADRTPKTVYHHKQRGIDHKAAENGLDLRTGKNINVKNIQTDPNSVVNRLIVLGYGDDGTQLVEEVRSAKDAQGRVPSDPLYKVDENGVYPDKRVARNLIANPGAEVNATDGGVGVALGNTLTRSTTSARSGSACFLVTEGGTSDLSLWNIPNKIPVDPSTPYHFSAWMRWSVGNAFGGLKVIVYYYNASGSYIGEDSGPTVTLNPATGTYHYREVAFTTPANCASISWRCSVFGPITGGSTLRVDDLMLLKNPPAIIPASFNGSSTNAYWVGTPHNSDSILTDPTLNYDITTGGTSEEIYGPRYGTHRDAALTTRYQARETGQILAENSAFPAESYEIEITRLDNAPLDISPGDIVPVHINGRDLKKRILTVTSSIDTPETLQITLGDPRTELSATTDRIEKDVSSALSFINNLNGE